MSRKNHENKKLLSWKETWQLNLRVLRLLFQEYPQMVLSRMAGTVWNALTPYVGIGLSARIVEELSQGRRPGQLKALVLATLLCAALTALVSALLSRYRAVADTAHYQKMNFLLSRKMLEMDFQTMDDPGTRQKLSTIHQFNMGGGWGLPKVLGNFEGLLYSLSSLAGGAALTATLFTSRVPDAAGNLTFLNSPLFLLLLIAAMLGVTWLSPALNSRGNRCYALNSDLHNLANRLFGYWGWLGHRRHLATDMRIYRQDQFCAVYNKDKTATFHSKGYFARKSLGSLGFYVSAATAVSSIFTVLVYLFVCLKAWAGAFGIGMVTQYISSISRFSGSIGSLFGITGDMRNNASFLKQTLDFLDTPSAMSQGSKTVEKACAQGHEVEFRDVSFRYPGSEQYALRHVNLKFRAGQRLAVVGQNGSGKTTFIKLLCRLYDPSEGAILLDGVDIREYDYTEYLSVFSVVFQDFALTDLSLGSNLAAEAEYDPALAKASLEKAGFEDRLETLPHGLDTYLSKALSEEGVEMSGGERQKIAIARALYKPSSFLILDEPTAALDPIAEAEIYSRLGEIIEDRTAIYISHRLSSCRFCGDILVFDKGALIQQGSHEALTADETGKYYELWRAQAQYYENESEECAAAP